MLMLMLIVVDVLLEREMSCDETIVSDRPAKDNVEIFNLFSFYFLLPSCQR